MYNARPCCNSSNVAVEVVSALEGIYNEFVLSLFFLQLTMNNNPVIVKTTKTYCILFIIMEIIFLYTFNLKNNEAFDLKFYLTLYYYPQKFIKENVTKRVIDTQMS